MNITLNGKPHNCGQARTIQDLIAMLGYTGKRIAVERNGDIVPKSQHAQAELAENDAIEIVVAVGGG
ncbi:sulfur carrier protein ThiS [Eoetvoesiella caeni]|uniref:Sulfur carrier protein n=1 Tax=Eoetvoesiella caeni TaxID=645616 RepID=A0A366H717_9BURK|nr:sulfur carrier protein ThiS [Eoetvoesiella caeni]MCI2810088.1 sulfur carrier protein ThiS [Eoetvoesiella caeni]NYT56408.1 sulfur carrier protein ThiS [Eoetvoesiella caeni]RBP37834.1 sulfur carrier protein [Eoetvoesiella caeni]